jgi:hypothetical protein
MMVMCEHQLHITSHLCAHRLQLRVIKRMRNVGETKTYFLDLALFLGGGEGVLD